MELIDLTGRQFGKLTVIERAPDKVLPSGKRCTMWRCQCECGREFIADGSGLRRGQTTTCGCWKKPKPVHGMPNYHTKRPEPITIQYDLIIGQVYSIHGRQMKCIGIYNGFARFETDDGFHECYHFWDLERMIT